MTAYEQGFAAFLDGATENPYPAGTEDARQWQCGWNRAHDMSTQAAVKQ